jgi:hypothetical protein
MSSNKGHQTDIFSDVKVKLKFTLKIYNISTQEDDQYNVPGLTFLMYLEDLFNNRQEGEEIVKIFLNCMEEDGTSLVQNASYLKTLEYSHKIKIEDNPNNPTKGTKENPLQYKCTMILFDFVEPSPPLENCLKKGCDNLTQIGVCPKHENNLTTEEIEDLEDYQNVQMRGIEEFTHKLYNSNGSYNLIGTHELPEEDEEQLHRYRNEQEEKIHQTDRHENHCIMIIFPYN